MGKIFLFGSLAAASVAAGLIFGVTHHALPVVPQQRTNITKLYEDTCGKCHGMNAEGGGAGTRTLLTKEKFDQKYDRPFFDAIDKGVASGGMEAYGQTFTKPEIWALVVHIRELQSKALRAEFGSPKAVDGVIHSQRHDYRIETVVDTNQGLKTPWAIDWLPDGRMLVTNRPGSIMVVDKGKTTLVTGVPPTSEIGQGGFMDITVHPDYAKNGWIYLSLTDPKKGNPGEGMTKIVRGTLSFAGDQPTWTGQETLFELGQEHYSGSSIHFGSRIVFDHKGHVFFSIGERGSGDLAQDLTKPNGKVYRINEDGSIPKDNPFADDASKAKGYIGQIWSYGHRNPQGLTIDLDGNVWDTEHAPRGGDEVNLIQKGKNYGWPIISFGINYNDSAYAVPWPSASQNFVMPVFRWLPSTGCCGMDTIRGSAFPQWKGDLLAGGLSGQNVDRLRVTKDKLIEREELIQGIGRVRETVVGPDGFIYVALNQPDKIIRLVPAK